MYFQKKGNKVRGRRERRCTTQLAEVGLILRKIQETTAELKSMRMT